MKAFTFLFTFSVLIAFTVALPPPWVQKLIESKSGFRFEEETTTEPPIIIYSAAVVPHPKAQPKPHPPAAGPTQYPWWKWVNASGKKGKSDEGAFASGKKGKPSNAFGYGKKGKGKYSHGPGSYKNYD